MAFLLYMAFPTQAANCLPMYTLVLEPAPFNGTDLFLEIDKSTEYQIWIRQIQFFFC